MPIHVCKHCSSSDLDKDPARGDTVCKNCGTVLEENAIVSEVEFQESRGGGQSMVGQFVSADSYTISSVGGNHTIYNRSSRELTIQKARKGIQRIASQLHVNQQCVEEALGFYKLALMRKLVTGRRSSYVYGASLYVTCRLEGTAHMLLDFCDVLQVNIYELGRVYMFLSRSLYLKLPPTDPCVYVTMIAMRVVQRMKRDWMGFGRRPTGLCGAALLVAARFCGFYRSVEDVVKVVNIGAPVLKRRMDEFAITPSAKLTMDEFKVVDLEEECDPPSFTAAKLKVTFTS
ncbi:unnamed protein product [Soboliphyme baturini]|uniref:TFIIB-type domain-containing protein n=1 Tax=Soboliphyme baturini TaxID=241478 RepID=A0A183IJ63_9BILA|nr:unnamed protein product [Soboliphyme baturini]